MLYTSEQTQNFFDYALTHLKAAEQNHVLTLTLARPEKKNALNALLLRELAFALSYAHYQKNVWLLVLAAEGDVFCAGMDLGKMGQTETLQTQIPEPKSPIRLGELLANLQKPCVARVQGAVLAGGFLLVGGCSQVVAVEEATFSLPEVRRGIFPFQVLATLLEIMPDRQALDLCMRAPTLSAMEAQQLGLVTETVKAADLDAAVQKIIIQLLEMSPSAIRLGLRAYQAMKNVPLEQRHAFLYDQLQAALQTADAQEGIAAFLGKRNPVWRNE